MSKTATPDSVLTEDQSRTLPILLDMIIPPAPHSGMPGAGELDFVGYLEEFEPGQIAAVQLELDMLNQQARDQYARPFADLDQNERDLLVARLRSRDVEFVQTIVTQTMACYYQDDKVVVALGMESRPVPYPTGHEVKSGDLSLLDPVRERKQLYRNA